LFGLKHLPACVFDLPLAYHASQKRPFDEIPWAPARSGAPAGLIPSRTLISKSKSHDLLVFWEFLRLFHAAY
jgi:hypothetical protein